MYLGDAIGPAALAAFTPTGAYASPGSNPVASAAGAYLQNGGSGSPGGIGGSSIYGVNGWGGIGIPGTGLSTPLGFNLGTANTALGGLQAVGNLWQAWEANKLAKQQFAYQKRITDANLANQISSYNTALEDRIRSRAAAETGQAGGLTADAAAAYIAGHSLKQPGG
jgi:hypothetical protein